VHWSEILIAGLKQLNLPQLAVRYDSEHRYKDNLIIANRSNSLRDRVNIFKPALNLLQYNSLGALMVSSELDSPIAG